MPPLRDRREDIPLLVHHFISEFNAQNKKAVRGVDPEALRILHQYAWPGNVRELRNVIERAVILSNGEFIEADQLPGDLSDGGRGPRVPSVDLTAGMSVHEAERQLIELTLAHTRNNKTRAAEILGITTKTLQNKLKRFGHDDEEPTTS